MKTDLWTYGPLTVTEATRDMVEHTSWVGEHGMNQILSSVGSALNIDVPSRWWNLIKNPNFMWNGDEHHVSIAEIWVQATWNNSKSASKTNRCLTIGCLKCGHRTPEIYPWSPQERTYGGLTGKATLEIILEMFR
jgi:hypothetical protein